MGNQSGALTLDFIFALVLVLSMTLLLGIFSFSLSVIEGIQYLTFSSSRAYYASHITIKEQEKAAEEKFNSLKDTGAYKKLLKKDWFSVSIANIGDSGQIYDKDSDRSIFTGVRTKVVVGLLELQIPFFGSTKGDQPFETFVTSFLGRESSTEECMKVIDERFNGILKLGYSGGTINPSAYASYDDNGC